MVSKKQTKIKSLAESLAQRHGRGFKRTQEEWKNSIADHIGKFIDKLTTDDIVTLSIGLWGAKHTNDIKNFPFGMIGYKLARAPSIPTAMVGVGILAALGIGGLPMAGQDTVMIQPPDKPEIECPEGSLLKWSILGGWQCVKVRP